MIIGALFLIYEFFSNEENIRRREGKKRVIFETILSFSLLLYLSYAILFKGREIIEKLGEGLGVALPLSFYWFFDSFAFTLYIVLALLLQFGFKALKSFLLGLIYLLATTTILALDAFFPYDSLGPLQSIVPLILYTNSFLLSLVDVKTEIFENIMEIQGENFFRIRVFWPSAGVHSLIIYSFIMLAFLLKFSFPLRRKILYFSFGALGTFIINILRIFLLSYYAAFVQSEIKAWEEFHSILGEILFLPWLLGYLSFVIFIEAKRARALKLPPEPPAS